MFSAGKDLRGKLWPTLTPRFCRCGNRGLEEGSFPPLSQGARSSLNPVPCPAQYTPLRPPASLQSGCGGHWLRGSTLVSSPGRHAALSELGQVGAPGVPGPGSTVRPPFGASPRTLRALRALGSRALSQRYRVAADCPEPRC